MSKSSTASTPKTSSQLPSKSAWSKGPPANTSTAPSTRPQSPAPSTANAPSAPPTHSRRPSTLGQGVAFKDGVGARNPAANASKSGSSVTFGSIDDASAPISSSPAAVPTIKSDGIKSFGSVPATTSNGKGHSRTTSFSTGTPPSVNASSSSTSSAGPSATSTSSAAGSSSASSAPKPPKFDVKSLFQKPSQEGPSTSSPAADVTSPPNRSAPLPQPSLGPQGHQASHQSPPSQMGASYPTFRPQQNGSVSNTGVPRSPSFPRQMANGSVNGRPPSTPGGPPSATMPPAMSSPRMGPPHGGQPPPVPHGAPGAPVPVQWPGGYYYYPTMDPNYYPHTPQPHWMPQHMVPPQHAPQGPPGSMPGMPMSPRGQQPNLHPPGTPTMTPAMPPNAHPPHPTPSPHMHTSSLSSISSTPSTPASTTAPGGGISRLNSNANSFTPKRIVIKSETGQEVDLDRFKKQASAAVSSPVVPSSPARRTVPVRIETEEAKRKRLAEEEAAKRKEKEAEESAKKEAEEKARREEEERKKKEEEEQKKKQEEERQRQEEAERKRKEEEEKERQRKEEEEKERQRKEAEEKARREEEARKRKEEEERVAKEAQAKAKEATTAESKPEPSEEGEVQEPEQSQDAADEAAKEEAKDKVSDKAPLRIDTSLTTSDGKRRPGRLDLSSTKNSNIPQPLPSALATARIIEDISSIEYPEGIMSPKPELNVNAKQGKFRYDRDFLLQFMAICKEKPDSLPPLDAIGLEPVDQFAITRGGSHGSHIRRSSSAMPPPSSNTPRQASVGLGISGFNKPSVNPFNMGQFSSTPKTSEDRFMASNRSTSMSGPAGMPFGRPSPMVRSSSQGGPGGSGRTRSQRGGKRDEKRQGGGQGSSFGPAGSSLANAMSLEPVAPLEVSANRWTPASLVKKGQPVEQDSPEVVDRKVRALLNKLTMERFDSISDQIIAWANKSEKEQDGRTLIQVIRLVFEKATDEATWSEMYARLCRKMMEQISPNVRDDGIKNAEGKPIAGGQLFRKYLLNRCQEDFERGWVAKEATAAAAAAKATEDQAAKAAAEQNEDGEAALYSDEYYAAQKAKRQGLGLIKFIGELFKLQMLTERIMHECIKKLLGNVENPEEEEIESLCKLLTTVGALLDTPKARAHMDVYFSRMKELTKSGNVNSRMQFMLLDVLELRERKWIPRNAAAAPTTIAALREQMEKEKASQEKDAMNRTLSMSRGGSRRGGDRGDHQQPDGWAVAGGATAARQATKAGDLSQFGKINKSTPMTFGPSSVFQKDSKSKSRESTLSRQGSSNMFSMLSANPEITAEVTSAKSSRPPSRKSSIDLGSGGAPEAPPQRRKLQLLPRSVPLENKPESTPGTSTAASEDEGAESTNEPSMSVEEAKTRIEEDSKEFFSIRDLDEAEVYFTKLPAEHRHLLVDKLVTRAVESKEADAQLVAGLFERAHAKNLCSPATFEEGFMPTAEIIDDIAIDAPKALNLFALMLKGAHLHEDEERRARLTSKSMDSEKLVSLLTS